MHAVYSRAKWSKWQFTCSVQKTDSVSPVTCHLERRAPGFPHISATRANNMAAPSPDSRGETVLAVSLRHPGPDEPGSADATPALRTTESHRQGREVKRLSSPQ